MFSMRWFRKHQTGMMIFFGVGLMAIFGLGSVVGMLDPSQVARTSVDPVIADWKGGEITEGKLESMRYMNFQTRRFLFTLSEEAAKQMGGDHNPQDSPIEGLAGDQVDYWNEQMLNRLLLAEKAKEEGIVVSDSLVDDYLVRLGGDAQFSRLNWEDLNRAANERGAHIEDVRKYLKLELAYRQMRTLLSTGIPMVPNPTEAIQLHERNTRRIECEVIPVKVADHMPTTEQPVAALKKTYEEGKFDYPDPTGEEPGFKVGRQVKVQYLKADFDTFLLNETNKLTDAQIEAKYNELVQDEDPNVMEIVPDEPAIDNPESGDDPAPSGEMGDDEAPSIGGEAPAEEATEGSEKQEGSGESTEGGGQSNVASLKGTQFVSTANQEEQTPVKEGTEPGAPVVQETPVQETPVEEGVPIVQEAVQEEAGQEGVTETPAVVQEGVESGTQNAEMKKPDPAGATTPEMETPETGDQDTPVAEQAPGSANDLDDMIQVPDTGPTMEDDEIKKRPIPLEKCKETIKSMMMTQPATEAMKAAVARAENEVREYHFNYLNWENTPERERGEVPTPIDVKALADKHQLQFAETDLVDDIKLEETEIGKVLTIQTVAAPGQRPQMRPVSVSQIIFNGYKDAKPYSPNTVENFITNSTYCYWLSDKMDAHIPEFEDAKATVNEFLNKKDAIEAAKKIAQGYVDQTNVGEKLMSEVKPTMAVSTGEFTWFSRGQISTPVGVENPGDDFMQTAFQLKERYAAVAANASNEIVYAVQSLSPAADASQFAKDYMENQYFKFKRIPQDVSQASQFYGRGINLNWNKEFTDDMELKFKKD